MMRYNRPNSKDWVEIEGAADLPMRDYTLVIGGTFSETRDMLKTLIVGAELHERNGDAFGLVEDADWTRLSTRQVRWLRETVSDAIKDELLDPLA